VIDGEQGLFVRSDWVEHSWQFYEELLREGAEVRPYPPGSWGPAAAMDLVAWVE
jgi:glucose-6-phosphate 1-dehydrogenase